MPRGRKKAEPEVKEDVVVETAEQPKKKAGRKPKAQQETKPVGKRPAARKAVKTAESEGKPKKVGGRLKANDKAAPAEKKATKKNIPVEEKPKRKYVRKTQEQPVEAAAAPAEVSKEEIIDKIIAADISASSDSSADKRKVRLIYCQSLA